MPRPLTPDSGSRGTEFPFPARVSPSLPLGPLTYTKRPAQELSEETLRVLRVRAQGKTYLEVAAELGIVKHTVGYHVQRTKRLLQVDTPEEAVEEAKARGLI